MNQGHNIQNVVGERLGSFVERIERLEEEKSNLSVDIREIYFEAKGAGFDAKTIRKIVAWKKKDAEKRREEKELFELYVASLGFMD